MVANCVEQLTCVRTVAGRGVALNRLVGIEIGELRWTVDFEKNRGTMWRELKLVAAEAGGGGGGKVKHLEMFTEYFGVLVEEEK